MNEFVRGNKLAAVVPDVPWLSDADRIAHERAEFYAAHERAARAAFDARVNEAAEQGRWLADAEDAALDALLVGPVVSDILSGTIPARLSRRGRAGAVLQFLRGAGYLVYVRHGAVRVNPPPPRELASLCHDLEPELSDLLDDDDRPSDPSRPVAHPGETAGVPQL